MMREDLRNAMEEEGYEDLREVKGRGLCGVMRFIFTTAVVVGIDWFGYVGRYCFGTKREAQDALREWDVMVTLEVIGLNGKAKEVTGAGWRK